MNTSIPTHNRSNCELSCWTENQANNADEFQQGMLVQVVKLNRDSAGEISGFVFIESGTAVYQATRKGISGNNYNIVMAGSDLSAGYAITFRWLNADKIVEVA